jgi:hypothetical protein
MVCFGGSRWNLETVELVFKLDMIPTYGISGVVRSKCIFRHGSHFD